MKTNKERGAGYSDFDLDSTELPSECYSNITYLQTLVQDSNDLFSLNSDALVPQMSIDHAFDHLITIFHQEHQTKST